MKDDGEEKSLTTEELHGQVRFYEKELFDCQQERYGEKEVKRIWVFITFFILCACLYNTKHKIVWIPHPNDRQMQVDVSDWWGWQKQSFYPVWRKPSGDDYESWCIKYPDGTWQAFLVDDGESVSYWWPLKNYSSTPKK